MNIRFVLIAAVAVFTIGCLNGPRTLDPVVYNKEVVEFDTTNFYRLALDPSRIAVVDFYSPSCGTCIGSMWITDSLASDFGDKAIVGKVDVTNPGNDTLWRHYGIGGLPTFVFFKAGVELTRRAYWEFNGSYDSLSVIMSDILAGRRVSSRM